MTTSISASDISSMVTNLQRSIDSALKKATTTAQDPKPENVKEYQQDVKKSGINVAAMATDVGVLVKDTSRLNVMSVLGKNDTVDFYKVKVASSGDVALGQAGDAGVRFQLLDRTGAIVADSDSSQGKAYDAYTKMRAGSLSLNSGDYTVRISRDKSVSTSQERNYAFQLRMGTYTADYDTIARQPTQQGRAEGTSPAYLSLLTGDTSGNVGSLASLLAGSSRGRLLSGLF